MKISEQARLVSR